MLYSYTPCWTWALWFRILNCIVMSFCQVYRTKWQKLKQEWNAVVNFNYLSWTKLSKIFVCICINCQRRCSILTHTSNCGSEEKFSLAHNWLPVERSLLNLTNIWPVDCLSENLKSWQSRMSADTTCLYDLAVFVRASALLKQQQQKISCLSITPQTGRPVCDAKMKHLLLCLTLVKNLLLWAVAKIWAPGLSRCHSRPFQLSGYQHSGNCSSLIVKTDSHCLLWRPPLNYSSHVPLCSVL